MHPGRRLCPCRKIEHDDENESDHDFKTIADAERSAPISKSRGKDPLSPLRTEPAGCSRENQRKVLAGPSTVYSPPRPSARYRTRQGAVLLVLYSACAGSVRARRPP